MSEVNNVMCDLEGEMRSCLSSAQAATSEACLEMAEAASLTSTAETAAWTSSAYEDCSSQVSGYEEMKKLKRRGDMTDP